MNLHGRNIRGQVLYIVAGIYSLKRLSETIGSNKPFLPASIFSVDAIAGLRPQLKKPSLRLN